MPRAGEKDVGRGRVRRPGGAEGHLLAEAGGPGTQADDPGRLTRNRGDHLDLAADDQEVAGTRPGEADGFEERRRGPALGGGVAILLHGSGEAGGVEDIPDEEDRLGLPGLERRNG